MNIRSAGKTDIGLKRKVNEDSYLIASDLGLYILADGLGGNKAGDVASRMVVDNIENYWRKLRKGEKPPFVEEMKEDLSEIEKHIINSICLTNITVYEAGRIAKYKDMCSTVAILLLQSDSIWAANVGDSRIYLFDKRSLTQISEEHSLEGEKRVLGYENIEDDDNSLLKHVLTRAVGAKDSVDVYIKCIRPEIGDILMICSDGLTNYMSERSIFEVLGDFSISMERKIDVLIDEAKRGGGGDNISVILLEVVKKSKRKRWFR